MKKPSMIIVAVLMLGLVCATHLMAAENTHEGQTIIRVNQLVSTSGTDKTFTGKARIDRLYLPNGKMRSSASSVTYEPGARSHWHIHPVGQVLIVTGGVGRTGEWGKPVQEMRAGDVVICPAGVKHWHGASPDTFVTHLQITEVGESGKPAEWQEPVTDDQYDATEAGSK